MTARRSRNRACTKIMKETVVVGMSGGVDSSVAALLLKERGYQVIGVTMHLFDALENNSCCGIQGIEDARRVASLLGIPFYVMNFKEVFSKKVIDYFVREYQQGRTPNPCIACNRYVKWEALLEKSRSIGADYLATGHYARIRQLSNGRYAVCCSRTTAKDQTYALYNLTQEQLKHTLMPIGDYEKEEVRRMAAQMGLAVAEKPDSQEICFVEDGDYAAYMSRYTGTTEQSGYFVDRTGRILGEHKGISHYTIGQRKGLGLSLGHPVYVTEIRPSTREVVIGEEKDLWVTHLMAEQLNYMGAAQFMPGQRMLAKIRYSHKGEWCRVSSAQRGRLAIEFENPVRAVTPGQVVVFYDRDVVLGGGVIVDSDGREE